MMALRHWVIRHAVGVPCVFVLTLMSPSSRAVALTFTTIDVPGAIFTQVQGINAAGQIVGVYEDRSFISHGFLLDNGTFTTIDVPGATFTAAYGIDAAGQIVESYTDFSSGHGFLLNNGTFTTIDFPGGSFT
jgi:probable HAF family extracellular repeat protein